ncbi:MAG: FimB/Mfa2 family fimbrial subunit [Alistipes sp.]|nr:FimB/Mfa2 family fimbrial subunit [Alistipes sp.]
MKFNIYILSLAMISVALGSCIREDLSECYSINKLQLVYTGNDESSDLFQEKIGSVELYIFDAAVECVYNRALTDVELSQQEVTLPRLLVGEYRIICVANGKNTDVVATEGKDYSAMYFADRSYTLGEATQTNDSLYWASHSFTITSDDSVQVVKFESSHYDVLVEVVGVDAQSDVHIEMSGVAPCTSFDSNEAFGTPTTYYPAIESIASESKKSSTFSIMRHTDHSAVEVKLCDKNGAELAKVNLAEFLAANPSIDCSLNEVTIPISFTFKLSDFVVTLPEWYIQDIKPEF